MKLKLMNMAAMALSALLCLTTTGAWAEAEYPWTWSASNLYDGSGSYVPSGTAVYLVSNSLGRDTLLGVVNEYGYDMLKSAFESKATDCLLTIAQVDALGAVNGGETFNASVDGEEAYLLVFTGENLYVSETVTAASSAFAFGDQTTVSSASPKLASGGFQGAGWYTTSSSVPEPEPAGYSVSLKEGTEDASNWQGKAGEGEYQALPLEGVAAGTAVSVKYNGTKRVKSVKAVKVKRVATVTAPTAVAASLTYSGSAQTLFSAGSTTGGTMKYKVTTTNSKPASTADFKTTIDQGTNAGTYYLWYYVDGGDNYNTTDVNGTAVTKAIGKAAATLTCSTGSFSFSSYEARNSTKTKTGVSCTGGTINVTSANTGNCTVSYSSGTITVTRNTNSAFTSTQITVSVTPDANHTAPNNVTFNVIASQYSKAASSATSSDKGKLIGRDGWIYDNVAAATAAGTTAEAKIIYIGTTGHATYSHGLALALTDETSPTTTKRWPAANTACNTTKNTNTPVTNATWLLASKDQWNYMITAAGSYTALRDGFSSITGASNMQSNVYYWSSTEDGSDSAWGIYFGDGKWGSILKTNYVRVRACLAF